jgi:hypothetical protein
LRLSFDASDAALRDQIMRVLVLATSRFPATFDAVLQDIDEIVCLALASITTIMFVGGWRGTEAADAP